MPAGVAQRSVLLGSFSVDAYSKGIVSSNNNSSTSISTNNPFGSVGAVYGNVHASGNHIVFDSFTANEPGCIMVLSSLVPVPNYSSGMSHYLYHFTAGSSGQSDVADPLLESVGPQPIYSSELNSSLSPLVFGYSDRYAEYKDKYNEVHGLFVDGQSLSAFVLKRGFSGTPTINSSFLQIPTSALDEVAAVSSSISNYGYWAQFHFGYHSVMPLSRYVIPSLTDVAYEHGDSVVIDRGGTKL